MLVLCFYHLCCSLKQQLLVLSTHITSHPLTQGRKVTNSLTTSHSFGASGHGTRLTAMHQIWVSLTMAPFSVLRALDSDLRLPDRQDGSPTHWSLSTQQESNWSKIAFMEENRSELMTPYFFPRTSNRDFGDRIRRSLFHQPSNGLSWREKKRPFLVRTAGGFE